MTKPSFSSLFLLIYLVTTLPAFSQESQLGQSDWQTPGQTPNQGQWQQPQQSGQWQQSQLGQSNWQTPGQGQTANQGQWQQPQQQPQLGQSNWQMPGQGQAAGTYQEATNPQTLDNNSVPQQQTTQATAQTGHVHKSHEGLKNAIGGLGKAIGVGMGVGAPLAGAYLIGKTMNSGYGGYGYPGGMGMGGGGYGYPGMGYGGGYPGMGYGGGYPGYNPYGMGGLSSFMHY